MPKVIKLNSSIEKPESNFIDIDTTDVDEFTSINELLEKIISIKYTNDGFEKE